MENTPAYTYVNLNRTKSNNVNNAYVGGGIAIGVHKSMVVKNLEHLIPEELADQEILLIQAVCPSLKVWIVNAYFKNCTCFTKI